MNSLFRKMPYESLAGVHLGDDELFAATPNWLAGDRAKPRIGSDRATLDQRGSNVMAGGGGGSESGRT